MATLVRTVALALSTARDLLRRPGALVALGGSLLLVALLPRLATRALDTGPGLAVERTISTLGLYLSLFAGLAATRCALPGAPLGPSLELAATPLRPAEYAAGRFCGVLLAAAPHGIALLLGGCLAQAVAGALPTAPVPIVPAALGAVAQAAIFAAAGLCAAAWLGGDLGAIAVLAFVVCSRLAPPSALSAIGPVAGLLPDPARLELSRDAAFGRMPNAAVWSTALLASLCQAAALLLFACRALGRAATSRA